MLTALRNRIGVKPPELYKAAGITLPAYHRITTNEYTPYNPHICKKPQVFLLAFALISLDTREMTPQERKTQARQYINALLLSAGYCSLDSAAVPLNAPISACIDRELFDIPAINAYLAEQRIETLSVSTDTAEKYCEQGEEYIQKGDNAQALRCFTKAIRLKPDFIAPYLFRALLFVSQKRETEAIQDYTSAIRLQPDSAETYNRRGILYLKTGDYDRAISDFNETFRRYASCFETYRKQGEAYMEKSETSKSVRELVAANQTLLKIGDAFYHRGLGYAKKHNLTQTFLDFAEATKFNKDYLLKLFSGIESYTKKDIGSAPPNQPPNDDLERIINSHISKL